MTLEQLNSATLEEAERHFMQCCVAVRWVEQMVEARPFQSVEQLHLKAEEIWQGLGLPDYLQAFEGHPKIGDVSSLREKYANTKQLAAGEQSAVNQADELLLQRLSEGNDAYQEKFGFIFIVCATGKSAAEMLALLEQRMPNDWTTEIAIAAAEQSKITRIRLEKLLG